MKKLIPLKSLIKPMPKRFATAPADSSVFDIAGNSANRDRHSEENNRKRVEALCIIECDNGALPQKACEERIDESANLNHTTAHEYRKEAP